MVKYDTKELPDLIKREGYTHVDISMPETDGGYDVIWHTGSMSPKLKEGESLLRRGQFSRYDWDYVIAWKPKR